MVFILKDLLTSNSISKNLYVLIVADKLTKSLFHNKTNKIYLLKFNKMLGYRLALKNSAKVPLKIRKHGAILTQ